MNKKNNGTKKANFRKCIALGKVQDRRTMIRIVKTKDDNFIIDQKAKGRGAYICKDPSLIPLLLKKKLLHRAFKFNVPSTVYEQLIKIMEEKNEG